jgi:hypothetical protein
MSTPVTPPEIGCTIDDVAALIRARTKDSNGNEVGTFTVLTRPTDAQAQEAIDHQVVMVHTKVGYVGDGCAELARGVVAIGAAAEIELSYFPEQARTDRSPYTYLIQRYSEALQGLFDCVAGNLPDSGDTPADQPVNYRFGTVDSISGVVHAHYTGRAWPPLPVPPAAPATTDDDGSD